MVVDHASNKPIRVTGRADWACGYGTRDNGIILVAMEANRRGTFSEAESRLLAYLAILRQLHIQRGETDTTVQGFFTDGERYTFMAICNDGTVQRSHVFETDVNKPGTPQLKTIFNFIVTMLDTTSRSTRHAALTELGATRDRVVADFRNAVWGKAYSGQDTQIPEWMSDSDEDLLDMPDIR